MAEIVSALFDINCREQTSLVLEFQIVTKTKPQEVRVTDKNIEMYYVLKMYICIII